MKTIFSFAVLASVCASSCATLSAPADDPCRTSGELRIIDVKQCGAIGDGQANDTAAIQKAIDLGNDKGHPVFFPPGRYRITRSLTAAGQKRPLVLFGTGPASRLINNVEEDGNPTLVLKGKSPFQVSGLAFIGHKSFPNDAILITALITANGKDRSSYGTLRDLYLYPNGIGIHLTDTNTLSIENVEYWRGANVELGADHDGAANLKHAILADSKTDDQDDEDESQVNAVHIRFLRASEYAQTHEGGAAVKWNTKSPSGLITVSDSDLEAPGNLRKTSIDFTNVYKFSLRHNWLDHTDLRFVNSRYGDIQNNSAGSFFFGNGTQAGGCTYILVLASNPWSFHADEFCEAVGVINSTFDQGGYVNQSKGGWGIGVFGQGSIRRADELGAERLLSSQGSESQPELGIKERGRETPMGEWTAPEVKPAIFTATQGSWEVEEADVTTFSYTLVGTTMTLTFFLDGTTIENGPASALRIEIPEKRRSRKRSYSAGIARNGDRYSDLTMETRGDEYIYLYPGYPQVWQNGTGNNMVGGTFTFEVLPPPPKVP